MPELVAPTPLLAAALVALNDRWLKGRAPGVLTGKLSDVAGAFVLPLFLSALLALLCGWSRRTRLRIGVVFTVAAITTVKLSPEAARAVAGALDLLRVPLGRGHGRIVPDPTDLVAIPFAVAAYWYGLQAGRGDEEVGA